MDQGFITLHRKFLAWEWAGEPNMVSLFVHLLLLANHEAKKWQGIGIGRGQLVSSVQSLSARTGLSVSQIRTGLKRLEMTGEIANKTTNKYSIITICKYDSYQTQTVCNDKQNDKQIANKSQTNRNQIATNNNDNNNINNNNIITLSNERVSEVEKVEAIEEKPKAKTKGKTKNQDPYFNPLKECFMNFYSLLFQSEYYWEAKDSVAIKGISKKLTKAAKDKGLDATPESIAGNFQILLENITDKWILDRMSPTLINSKYNEIISNIKQKKQHGNYQNIRFVDPNQGITGQSAGKPGSLDTDPNLAWLADIPIGCK